MITFLSSMTVLNPYSIKENNHILYRYFTHLINNPTVAGHKTIKSLGNIMKFIQLKRVNIISLIMLLLVTLLLGRGLVTNPNQSAEYVRMLNRNASTNLDAAYFNPAGLTALRDGLYLSLSSQSFFATDKITSHLTTLNSNKFNGKIRAYVFPDIHVLYKKHKLAFSGSLMPIGGGGGGVYADGLPSFEYPYAGQVGQSVDDYSTDHGSYGTITGYTAKSYFSGASVYFAGQANAAYRISNMLSVAVGGRLVGAYNQLDGSIKKVVLNTSSGPDLTSSSITKLADHVMEVTQTGVGFTGIVSANMTHRDHMNIGLRYEFVTPLELETHNDNKEALHLKDGEKTNADMPAMFGLGISYQMVPMIRLETSFNYYFNKAVDWDGVEDDVDNGFAIGLGVEHSMGPWLASVGYLYSKTGATTAYRNDARMALDHHNVGFGVGYKLSDTMEINVGGVALIFLEETKTLPALNNTLVPHEVYNELFLGFTIGVNYSL